MTKDPSIPADLESGDGPGPDEHLTVETLDLLLLGDLPAESLLGLLLEHLQEVCSPCAEAVQRFQARLGEHESAGDESPAAVSSPRGTAVYEPAFNAAVASVRRFIRRMGEMQAAERAAELQALPAAERYRRLMSDPGLPSPDLCLRLLDRARAAARGDLQETAELARLALAVAERLDPRLFPMGLIFDCQADCWALLGEVHLQRGNDRAGELALSCAESLLAAGSGDPLSLAQVSSGRAQLLRLRGDLEGCALELGRAVDLYSAGADPHVRGRTLLHRGLALQELGRSSEARETLQAGIGLLDPDRDRELASRGRAALLETLDGPGPGSSPAPAH